MQELHAELIDLDAYTDLLEASVIIETIREAELLIHLFKHPVRGVLTGIQAGSAVLLVQGGYADHRERALRLIA